MVVSKRNLIIYLLTSKFNYMSLKTVPTLSALLCSIIYWGKTKFNYMLFFLIILNILFFSFIIKSSRSKISKSSAVISVINRGVVQIDIFFKSFIYFYYPSVDSFTSEIYINKITLKSIYFTLAKFPYINEVDLFVQNLESLANFFLFTKIQFILFFTNSKNQFDCYSLLRFFRFPILTT